MQCHVRASIYSPDLQSENWSPQESKRTILLDRSRRIPDTDTARTNPTNLINYGKTNLMANHIYMELQWRWPNGHKMNWSRYDWPYVISKKKKERCMMTDRVPWLVPFNVAVVLMVRSVADPPACMPHQPVTITFSLLLMVCSVVTGFI